MKYYATFENDLISSIRPLDDSEYNRIKDVVQLTEVTQAVADTFAAYRGGRCGLVAGQLEFFPDGSPTELKWASVKQQRARLLAGSDWMVTKATESGQAVQPEWIAYRQALRDITLQSDPWVIVWPVAPQ